MPRRLKRKGPVPITPAPPTYFALVLTTTHGQVMKVFPNKKDLLAYSKEVENHPVMARPPRIIPLIAFDPGSVVCASPGYPEFPEANNIN